MKKEGKMDSSSISFGNSQLMRLDEKFDNTVGGFQNISATYYQK